MSKSVKENGRTIASLLQREDREDELDYRIAFTDQEKSTGWP
jgi:hypothetical protein